MCAPGHQGAGTGPARWSQAPKSLGSWAASPREVTALPFPPRGGPRPPLSTHGCHLRCLAGPVPPQVWPPEVSDSQQPDPPRTGYPPSGPKHSRGSVLTGTLQDQLRSVSPKPTGPVSSRRILKEGHERCPCHQQNKLFFLLFSSSHPPPPFKTKLRCKSLGELLGHSVKELRDITKVKIYQCGNGGGGGHCNRSNNLSPKRHYLKEIVTSTKLAPLEKGP